MGEALRLTGAGRLAEATALLQGLPQNVKSSKVSKEIKREATTRAGRAGQLIDMVPPRSASGHWTAPRMDTQEHDAALAEGVTPPHMRAALRELLDRFGNPGSSWGLGGLPGNRSPEAKTPLADGAPFEERAFPNRGGSAGHEVFVPSRYCEEPLPLVIMLHGCKQ